MVLVPENTLERLQQRQQILTPPITQTLRNLDSEMTDILSSKELDDEKLGFTSKSRLGRASWLKATRCEEQPQEGKTSVILNQNYD